ncbi:pilus assembly protein [Metapseudomonas lalkuanensis]|uniref:Pilus assembly protein n=1 Tax=Metapseudomonas lalkuanensis TaxID=2604832 RepID=A0A5J6QP34_9GAMM|nr:TadE family protein [Pseudomonas lalkuanensis]QEY64027.1 pilus assembly protein [Pseudomonas lalkuanensis]UCO96640.1 pilus assembly protein [Pseudomonas lalkuanensis]
MKARRMRGTYTVEFAITGLVLFVVLFGMLEMGRLFFTINALNETVRRGARLAAVCDISDPVVLRRAIFNAATDSGASSLINQLDTADLSLVYLDEGGATVASPGDTASATGFRAIRYVELRLQNFTFNFLIPGFGGSFTLPVFRSTMPRESLGRHAEVGVAPGITPC